MIVSHALRALPCAAITRKRQRNKECFSVAHFAILAIVAMNSIVTTVSFSLPLPSDQSRPLLRYSSDRKGLRCGDTQLRAFFGNGKDPEDKDGMRVLSTEDRESQLGGSRAGNQNEVEWDVYVDQSKASMERGAGATLDSFVGMSPAQVQVHPAIFKTKTKSPAVRCVFRAGSSETRALEVSNVDSVDKVFRILTHHMSLKGIDKATRECLKWKFKGNGYLEAGEIKLALEAYDEALQTGCKQQEGTILLMRATAYLRRASTHKRELRQSVNDLTESVPDATKLQLLYEEVAKHSSLANPIFRRVLSDAKSQDIGFEQTKFRHGLYQYALLHSAKDALRATQLLSNYSNSWLRAGQILSELWKLNESIQYYNKAAEVDPTLTKELVPVLDRLRKRQELIDNAKSYGWTEETLRLALDVAG